jgi:hypothetical protein
MKNLQKNLTKNIDALNSINLERYISSEMKFAEPLSNLSYLRLCEFQEKCRLIEKLFSSIQANLLDFEYCVGNYGTCLYLTFSPESSSSIKKNRWYLYQFFINYFPVNFRQPDWFYDNFIHQTISSYRESKDGDYVRIKLALNHDQLEIEFPSHDFFCYSYKELMDKEELIAA